CLFLCIPCASCSPLFPYTTLFRSHSAYLSLVVLYDVFVHAFSVEMQVYLPTLCHSYAYEVEWETILLNAYEQKHVFLVIFVGPLDRKSTRLNSSHVSISYAVFFLK